MAVKALLTKRALLRGKITRVLNRDVTSLTPVVAQDTLETLNKLSTELEAICDELFVMETEEDQQQIRIEEFDQDMSRIELFRNRLLDAPRLTATPSSSSSNAEANASLMPVGLTIPPFDGDEKHWASFSDLFQTVIDNNRLTDAQKLQYLKSVTTGRAARYIEPFSITDANFKKAWEALLLRFKNTMSTVYSHVDSILDHRVIRDNPEDLDKFMDTVRGACLALEAINRPIHDNDFFVRAIEKKLHPETQQAWRLSITSDSPPKYEDLTTFLVRRAKALVNTNQQTIESNKPNNNRKPFSGVAQTQKTPVISIQPICPVCNTGHKPGTCDKFKSLPLEERRAATKRKHLCFNCLLPGHAVKNCTGSSCRMCHRRHHTLLHIPENVQTTTLLEQNECSLLPTAHILVKGADGTYQQLRALLDTGSMASLITDDAVERLQLPKKNISKQITCVADLGRSISHSVNLVIRSLKTDFTTESAAMVVPTISCLPAEPINTDGWTHIRQETLADSTFHIPSNIDVLLGVGVVSHTNLPGTLPPPVNNLPWVHNTQLGWVVYGQVPTQITKNSTQLHTKVEKNPTTEDFYRMWQLEQPTVKAVNEEEIKAEDDFQLTHKRRSDGSYTVQLPVKEKFRNVDLSYTRPIAVKRLIALERKFKKVPEMGSAYVEQMQQYIQLGHMELVPPLELTNQPVCYLPHHAVWKQSSTTTKMRIVFDASAAPKGQRSLNDIMWKGGRIQDELISILLRFRLHSVAIITDIHQMYRQIHLAEQDHDLHRVLWRTSSKQPIREFRLKRLTFGTKAAPFLATRVLKQLAADEINHFPQAAEIISRDVYMDDVMTGVDDPASALKLQQDLIQLMSAGKFVLQKWASNYPLLPNTEPTSVNIPDPDCVSTLGIKWFTNLDQFVISYETSLLHTKVTKRTVLSEASKLFDPMGWLAPITIFPKMFLQCLWKEEYGWDDNLDKDKLTEWKTYIDQLQFLKEIRIQRFLEVYPTSKVTLIGFADASERAYSAVVYVRAATAEKTTSHLLVTKTRVAPIKATSIPRLELAAAVLLARLIHSVQESTGFKDFVCYTDSTIVLHWVHAPSYSWHTFVANRVAEIQSLTKPNQWHHVISSENPADRATRSTTPQFLKSDMLWWHGPSWITHDPLPTPQYLIPDTVPETRKVQIHNCVIVLPFWEKYSRLSKAVRVMAYVLRFINKIRKRQTEVGAVIADEYRSAIQKIISLTQFQWFGEEMRALLKQQRLPIKSKLLSLNPILDKIGLLRAKGRLQNADLSYDRKCPIILPPRAHITRLIVTDMHQRHLHAGPQLTLTNLRNSYWITNGIRTVKKILHGCVTCRRQKMTMQSQMMADLPAARVRPAKAFENTGIDYGGPIVLKQMNRRSRTTSKGYIALFICLATKAVHIEAVSDMTTEAFIAALRRFVARRGYCKNIYSDCGSNFIGANRELEEISEVMKNSEHDIQNMLAPIGTSWKFNPPHSPHFGGLWEAGIKATKYHLKRTIGNATLNFEELTTLLTQIEACLNSRPLCPLSGDPEDLSILTPGHFLIGTALTTPPDLDYEELPVNRLSRWQFIQKMTRDFWSKWSSEYLSRLQNRPKWMVRQPDLKVDDLVIIKDPLAPPTRWRMARVIKTLPGTDGAVRVVKLRTSSGEMTRPIHELCKLPSESSQ